MVGLLVYYPALVADGPCNELWVTLRPESLFTLLDRGGAGIALTAFLRIKRTGLGLHDSYLLGIKKFSPSIYRK
jgi:hypothetical protein